jgi:hypothetical protein
VCLDHLAIAARNERQVTKIIDETLCGKRFGHTPFQDDVPQSAATWLLDQHKLEILSTPISGKDSLVGKFLNARPSVEAVFHHVTFTVGEEPSRLRDFRDKASKLGFEIVGYNERPYKVKARGASLRVNDSSFCSLKAGVNFSSLQKRLRAKSLCKSPFTNQMKTSSNLAKRRYRSGTSELCSTRHFSIGPQRLKVCCCRLQMPNPCNLREHCLGRFLEDLSLLCRVE